MVCMNCFDATNSIVEMQPAHFTKMRCTLCKEIGVCGVHKCVIIYCDTCKRQTRIPRNKLNAYYANLGLSRRQLLCGCTLEISNACA